MRYINLRLTYLLTYRQTDRQTSCNGTVRAMHTRRAVKMCLCSICTNAAVMVLANMHKNHTCCIITNKIIHLEIFCVITLSHHPTKHCNTIKQDCSLNGQHTMWPSPDISGLCSSAGIS